MFVIVVLLSHYLASRCGQERIRGRNVVELGAGSALAGLVAARFANSVALTDGNEIVMDLLKRNAESYQNHLQSTTNKQTKIYTSEFQWGDRSRLKELISVLGGHVDVVVAADVVQWPDVIVDLVHSVKALLWSSEAKQPVFILGIVNRACSTYNSFFEVAAAQGFSWKKIESTEFLQDGVVPKSCQEFGGRETEIYEVFLIDRSKVPILLEEK